MSYITSDEIVPYPAHAPDLGVANSWISDPFCGNRILRVTDQGSFINPGASTLSASEAEAWSLDGEFFTLINRSSGGTVLYSFNPVDFTTQSLGPLNLGSPEFSQHSPRVVYGTKDLQVRRLDLESGTNKLIIDFRDFTEELQIPVSPRWYLNSLTVDYWEHRVACNMGPGQDQNALLLVWDTIEGLTWLNTQTGQFSEFGGRGSGQVPNWLPFGIHNCRISRNGDTLRSSGAGNNARAFWRPGTNLFQNVTPSPDVPISGHTALGFDTYFGARLTQTPFEFILAPLWNIPLYLDLMNPIPPNVPGWWSDYHISTRALAGDVTPLYISSYNLQGNPKGPGPPTSTVPGDNEIFTVSTHVTGQVRRYGHHYSTGTGNFYNSPRGNISPNGRFFVFTSDWYQSLGGSYPNQRSDVFILELEEVSV